MDAQKKIKRQKLVLQSRGRLGYLSTAESINVVKRAWLLTKNNSQHLSGFPSFIVVYQVAGFLLVFEDVYSNKTLNRGSILYINL